MGAEINSLVNEAAARTLGKQTASKKPISECFKFLIKLILKGFPLEIFFTNLFIKNISLIVPLKRNLISFHRVSLNLRETKSGCRRSVNTALVARSVYTRVREKRVEIMETQGYLVFKSTWNIIDALKGQCFRSFFFLSKCNPLSRARHFCYFRLLKIWLLWR